LFGFWLATLLLGPLVLTAVSGYFSWRRLAYPKVYILIGVVGLWGAAIAVAVRVLGSIGVSSGVTPGTDDGSRVLGVSLLIFLLVGVAFLFGLRYFGKCERRDRGCELNEETKLANRAPLNRIVRLQ
jgi:hypothetical protein